MAKEKQKQTRLGLVVSRELSPGRTWGLLIQHFIDQGYAIVGSKQPIYAPGLRTELHRLEIYCPDVTDASYLKIPIEGSAHATLNRFINRPEYSAIHTVLMSMLSRRDNSGTFRTLDREVAIRRVLLVLISQLIRSAPTHLVFEETPHEIVDFGLFEVARFMGIPAVFFQPSLVGPQVVARTALDTIFPVTRPKNVRPSLQLAETEALRISRAAVQKLRDGGGTALLDRQKIVDRGSQSFASRFRAVRAAAWFLFGGKPNGLINLTGHERLPRIFRVAYEMFSARSLRNSLNRSVRSLPNKRKPEHSRFAIFALHYEPERTSMPEGLPYLSQLDAVLAVRDFLPENLPLLVKEHYAQQSSSLRGYVGRSKLFYDFLTAIRGVDLIGVGADTRQLIREASAVFTMTGKVAIEAAFVGTPAIYLGHPWWGEMPGAYSFSELSRLRDLDKSPASDGAGLSDWFHEQIDSTLLFGLGGTSPEKYSARISKLPQEFEELEFASLAAAIDLFISRSNQTEANSTRLSAT